MRDRTGEEFGEARSDVVGERSVHRLLPLGDGYVAAVATYRATRPDRAADWPTRAPANSRP